MFSGIVEVKTNLLSCTPENPNPQQATQIIVEKPSEFKDISLGDSIAINGVCLTLERFDATTMQFALGAETLKVTGWTAQNLKLRPLNLERSLRFGDRLHGHLVSGHVDAMGKVIRSEDLGGSWLLTVQIPAELSAMVWPKGSIAINGVSLTINAVKQNEVEVCLIPETLRRTNLSSLLVGDQVTLEVDPMARALQRMLAEKERESHA
jgi:riboflavin synthase